MSSTEKPSGPGFTISDRRSFTEAGERRPADATPPENAEAPSAVAPEPPRAAPSGPSARGLPPVDFHTFIISLGSSALLHLGEIERPEGEAPAQDLGMAKHTIDILEMLQQKTKGNLSSNEDKLLGSLLYDLRLRFLAATKG